MSRPARRAATPTALVTDAELMSSVAVIRSLGRAGWNVVAASKHPHAPGLKSRYASVPLLIAGGQDLVEAAQRYGVDVLIPVTDETLLDLDPLREAFPSTCPIATSDPAGLLTAMDKWATLELARELGIPVPETLHLTVGAPDAGTTPNLGWPVVVKPRFSRVRLPDGSAFRCSTSYAFNEAELAAQVAALPDGSSVLLQRYRAGTGVSVCLLTEKGVPLSAFSHRRIREVPPSGGVSSLRESVTVDPVLGDYATGLLRRLQWTGVAMVEFKVDDGEPLLMEINGRIWGSLPLATRAGMDFPLQLAELYLPRDDSAGNVAARSGEQVDTSYRIGVRSRRLGLELDWIEAVLRGRDQPPLAPPIPRRAALRATAQLVDPRIGYDGVARDDLRPALADAAATGRRLLQRAKGLLPGR